MNPYNPDTQLLSYVLHAPETRMVAFLVGFFVAVVCGSLLSRVMTR